MATVVPVEVLAVGDDSEFANIMDTTHTAGHNSGESKRFATVSGPLKSKQLCL